MPTPYGLPALLVLFAAAAPATAQDPSVPPHVGTEWEARGLGITPEAFRAIRPGMTLQQVEAVVGRGGEGGERLSESGLRMYLWSRPESPESFSVSFRDGRAVVSLQHGLYREPSGPPATLAQYRPEVATLFGGPGLYEGFAAVTERVQHRYRWPGAARGSGADVTFAGGRATDDHAEERLQ